MLDWLTYAGLTRQPFPQRLSWARPPALVVLHSTEGGSYPGYEGGKKSPHFTVDPRGHTSRQHFPLSSAARALRAPTGGHTNTGGAIQIEIIGSCVVGSRLPSVLNLHDTDLGYLAGLLREIHAATGIPLTSTVRWSGYPASAGDWPGRLGWAAWNTYRGVLGHQHVPGNFHGDPGALDVTRLLQLATPTTAPTPPQEDDMPLNDADKTWIGAEIERRIVKVLRFPEFDIPEIRRDADAASIKAPIDVAALAEAVAVKIRTHPTV